MFHEAVDHTLRFIAVQPWEGCTSAQLGDFIERDLLPYFHFESNEILHFSIIRLIVDQHFDEINIFLTGAKKEDKMLSKLDTLSLIDESKVSLATNKENLSTQSTLKFIPEVSLRERFLGFRISTQELREGVKYALQTAVEGHGYGFNRSRSFQVGRCMVEFVKRQVVIPAIMIHSKTAALEKRVFLYFAFPKTIQLASSSDALLSPETTSSAGEVSPLDNYFHRQRAKDSSFPDIILNPWVVRQLVKESPDRKLLLPDAVDIVLRAHGCPLRWNSFDRTVKLRFAAVFESCGLRVIYGAVSSARSTQHVKIVLLAEDYAALTNDDGESESDEDEKDTWGNKNEDSVQVVSQSENDKDSGLPMDLLIQLARYSFFFCPGFSRAIQSCYEAERRPLSPFSAWPAPFGDISIRRRLIKTMMAYSTAMGTLRFQNVLLFPKDRCFTTVFYSASAKSEQTHSEVHPGLTAFTVDKVLQLLDRSKHKALSVKHLTSLMSAKVIRQRIIPYFLKTGKAFLAEPVEHGKGILALPHALLTPDIIREITEPQRAVYGQIPIVALPPPFDEVLCSKSTSEVGSFSSFDNVNKVMLLRNGYVRFLNHRATRLHLELWRQWYHRHDSKAKSFNYCMTLGEVYNSMTLSTFCIVIGMPHIDLGLFEELNQMGGDEEMPLMPGKLQWSTPLGDLPASLKEWCRRQRYHSFLMSVQLLEKKGLVSGMSKVSKEWFLEGESHWSPIEIRLSAEGAIPGGITIRFHSLYSTPGGTAHSILFFWNYGWKSGISKNALAAVSKYDLTPILNHLTLPKTIALSRFLRVNTACFSEVMFPLCGLVIQRKCPRLPRGGFAALRSLKRSWKGRSTNAILNNRAHSSRRAPAKKPRYDISADHVAVQLLAAVKSNEPLKRTAAVMKRLNRRLRRSNKTPKLLIVEDWTQRKRYSLLSCGFYNPYIRQSVAHTPYLGELIKPGNLAHVPDIDFQREEIQKQIGEVLNPNVAYTDECGSSFHSGSESAAAKNLVTIPFEDDAVPPIDEVLLDAIRCILLSDRAHFSAGRAQELLSSYPTSEIQNAFRYLAKTNSFSLRKDRKGPQDRIFLPPDNEQGETKGDILALQPTASILPSLLSHGIPRLCTNSALMNDCLYALEESVRAVAGVSEHQMIGLKRSRSACNAETPLLFRSPAPAVTVEVRKSNLPESRALVMSEKLSASLPMPECAFSSLAYELDGYNRVYKIALQDQDSEEDEERLAQLDSHPVKIFQTFHERFPKSESQMVLRKEGPLPKEEQETESADISSSDVLPTEYPLAYPSIFHHVNGVFHTCMWKLFLRSLHGYIFSYPGTRYSVVKQVMTLTGIISQRSLNVGLSYLLGVQAVVGRQGSRDSCESRRSCSPFSRQKRCRLEELPRARETLEALHFFPGASAEELPELL